MRRRVRASLPKPTALVSALSPFTCPFVGTLLSVDTQHTWSGLSLQQGMLENRL